MGSREISTFDYALALSGPSSPDSVPGQRTMEAYAKLAIMTFFVTTAAALTCWETPRSSNDEYMSKRSDELVITEKECSSSAKSCMSKGYDFRGKMQYIQLGCSDMDKSECNSTMKGKSNHFECYCKSDYCNGATNTTAGKFMAAIFTAVAVSVLGLGRSG